MSGVQHGIARNTVHLQKVLLSPCSLKPCCIDNLRQQHNCVVQALCITTGTTLYLVYMSDKHQRGSPAHSAKHQEEAKAHYGHVAKEEAALHEA